MDNAKNETLLLAKKEKNDEFYTKLSCIEREIKHYTPLFKNKVVYCNCDDPRESLFFRFFFDNFSRLQLKKLITCCYKDQQRDLFIQEEPPRAVSLEYSGWGVCDDSNKLDELDIRQLNGDGDFRGQESIELLKQADIVVTNPPFSLFREFVDQLLFFDKKFLIIGNVNALGSQTVFRAFQNKKIWLGYPICSSDMEFAVPDHYRLRTKSFRIDDSGKRFIKIGGVRWFTNLGEKIYPPFMKLKKPYNEESYTQYDNYDAINIDKTKDIPYNYSGEMGVPVTFLDKYNPDQFELFGVASGYHDKDLLLGGKIPYRRFLIRKRDGLLKNS